MKLSEITSATIAESITSLAEGRFILVSDEDLVPIIKEITPDSLNDTSFIMLKRTSPNAAGERTVLIAVVDSDKEVTSALRWAASVKDELLEPKNGDLYLFIAIKDESVSIEQCTEIEASDKICRRYVLRPTESIEGFLGRSFVGSVMSNSSTAKILDPLHLALLQTSEKHPWFDQQTQQTWREALLSGKSGSDLIEALFKL